jgi:hypothetical protein
MWKVNGPRTANANINPPAGNMNLCPCELEFLAHASTTTYLRRGGRAIGTPADPLGAEQIPANMIGGFLDDPPEAAPDADQEEAAGKRKVGKQ